MNRVLSIVLGLLLLTTVVTAQEPSSQVILDVKASGFRIEPVGEHTYLRVYANGQVAFDDYKPSIKGFYLYETKISLEQLASLKARLTDISTNNETTYYRLINPLNRIVQRVKITVAQPNGFHILEISDAKGSDPKAITSLICSIERLRSGARLRLVDLRKCTD